MHWYQVSVVVFSHQQGDQDVLYNFFVAIATALKDVIQGKLPLPKETAPAPDALLADLDRVASEVGVAASERT